MSTSIVFGGGVTNLSSHLSLSWYTLLRTPCTGWVPLVSKVAIAIYFLGSLPASWVPRHVGNVINSPTWNSMKYCWWKKSCTSWSVVLFPLFTRFYTFQVVQDFFHQPYVHCLLKLPFEKSMFGRYLDSHDDFSRQQKRHWPEDFWILKP